MVSRPRTSSTKMFNGPKMNKKPSKQFLDLKQSIENQLINKLPLGNLTHNTIHKPLLQIHKGSLESIGLINSQASSNQSLASFSSSSSDCEAKKPIKQNPKPSLIDIEFKNELERLFGASNAKANEKFEKKSNINMTMLETSQMTTNHLKHLFSLISGNDNAKLLVDYEEYKHEYEDHEDSTSSSDTQKTLDLFKLNNKETTEDKIIKFILKILVKSCRCFDVALSIDEFQSSHWRYANPLIGALKSNKIPKSMRIESMTQTEESILLPSPLSSSTTSSTNLILINHNNNNNQIENLKPNETLKNGYFIDEDNDDNDEEDDEDEDPALAQSLIEIFANSLIWNKNKIAQGDFSGSNEVSNINHGIYDEDHDDDDDDDDDHDEDDDDEDLEDILLINNDIVNFNNLVNNKSTQDETLRDAENISDIEDDDDDDDDDGEGNDNCFLFDNQCLEIMSPQAIVDIKTRNKILSNGKLNEPQRKINFIYSQQQPQQQKQQQNCIATRLGGSGEVVTCNRPSKLFKLDEEEYLDYDQQDQIRPIHIKRDADRFSRVRCDAQTMFNNASNINNCKMYTISNENDTMDSYSMLRHPKNCCIQVRVLHRHFVFFLLKNKLIANRFQFFPKFLKSKMLSWQQQQQMVSFEISKEIR